MAPTVLSGSGTPQGACGESHARRCHRGPRPAWRGQDSGPDPRVTRSLPGKWRLYLALGAVWVVGATVTLSAAVAAAPGTRGPWDPDPLGPGPPGSPAFWEQVWALWASFGRPGPEDGDPKQEGKAGEVWVRVLGRNGLASGFPGKGLPLTFGVTRAGPVGGWADAGVVPGDPRIMTVCGFAPATDCRAPPTVPRGPPPKAPAWWHLQELQVWRCRP